MRFEVSDQRWARRDDGFCDLFAVGGATRAGRARNVAKLGERIHVSSGHSTKSGVSWGEDRYL